MGFHLAKRIAPMTHNMLKRTKDALYVDGSLRDIYILGTNKQDWQKLLSFLRTSSYPSEFILAGMHQPIPDQIEEVFALVHNHGGMLRIDEKYLGPHCYFHK